MLLEPVTDKSGDCELGDTEKKVTLTQTPIVSPTRARDAFLEALDLAMKQFE